MLYKFKYFTCIYEYFYICLIICLFLLVFTLISYTANYLIIISILTIIIMFGRPKIHIDYDKVYSLRENHYNWVDIAKILDVSVTKLVTWRKSINFVEPLNIKQILIV